MDQVTYKCSQGEGSRIMLQYDDSTSQGLEIVRVRKVKSSRSRGQEFMVERLSVVGQENIKIQDGPTQP